MLIEKISKKINVHRRLKYFITLYFCVISPYVFANEVDKIPFYFPFHSSQSTQRLDDLYQDLIITGFDNFEIKFNDIWQQYQQDIRTGEPGVYFVAPHFSAWLIHKHNFIPLFQLDEKLKFVIASKIEDTHIFELSDLIDKKICSQNPLNLDYLLINNAFSKSIQAPDFHLVHSVYDELINENSVCSAFSISEHIYLEQEIKSPAKFTRLAQSKEWNNYAFLVHPSLADEYSLALTKFLSKEQTRENLLPFLKLLSQKAKLIQAKKSHYPKDYLEELTKYWSSE